jgi:hypothetical protein
MIKAMSESDLEPIVIEDLVRFGEDRGFEKGLQQGRVQGIEQGRVQGIEQGRVQGIEQGRAQGIEQGRAEALQELRLALLELMSERGLGPSFDERAIVEGETERATLRKWLVRAARANSVREIFD